MLAFRLPPSSALLKQEKNGGCRLYRFRSTYPPKKNVRVLAFLMCLHLCALLAWAPVLRSGSCLIVKSVQRHRPFPP